jgi:hypothetical protein
MGKSLEQKSSSPRYRERLLFLWGTGILDDKARLRLKTYGLDKGRLENLSDEVWWVRVQEMIRHNYGMLKLEDM